jgi:thiazole synthase ThiGH ThiG subunit
MAKAFALAVRRAEMALEAGPAGISGKAVASSPANIFASPI